VHHNITCHIIQYIRWPSMHREWDTVWHRERRVITIGFLIIKCNRDNVAQAVRGIPLYLRQRRTGIVATYTEDWNDGSDATS
jgi:hypothetical protein